MEIQLDRYHLQAIVEQKAELPRFIHNAVIDKEEIFTSPKTDWEKFHYELPAQMETMLSSDLAILLADFIFPFDGTIGVLNSYNGYLTNSNAIFEPLLILDKRKWKENLRNIGLEQMYPALRLLPLMQLIAQRLGLVFSISAFDNEQLSNKRIVFPQSISNNWNWGKLLGYRFGLQAPESIIQNLNKAYNWPHNYTLNPESIKVRAQFPIDTLVNLNFQGQIQYTGNASPLFRLHYKVLEKNGDAENPQHYRLSNFHTLGFVSAGNQAVDRTFSIELLEGEQLIIYYEVIGALLNDFTPNVLAQVTIIEPSPAEEWSIAMVVQGYTLSSLFKSIEESLGVNILVHPAEGKLTLISKAEKESKRLSLQLLLSDAMQANLLSSKQEKVKIGAIKRSQRNPPLQKKIEILRSYPSGFTEATVNFQRGALGSSLIFLESYGLLSDSNAETAQVFLIENTAGNLSNQTAIQRSQEFIEKEENYLTLSYASFYKVHQIQYIKVGYLYEWQRNVYELLSLHYYSEKAELVLKFKLHQ